jgi:hypothetical protein
VENFLKIRGKSELIMVRFPKKNAVESERLGSRGHHPKNVPRGTFLIVFAFPKT